MARWRIQRLPRLRTIVLASTQLKIGTSRRGVLNTIDTARTLGRSRVQLSGDSGSVRRREGERPRATDRPDRSTLWYRERPRGCARWHITGNPSPSPSRQIHRPVVVTCGALRFANRATRTDEAKRGERNTGFQRESRDPHLRIRQGETVGSGLRDWNDGLDGPGPGRLRPGSACDRCRNSRV